jgi:copper homeostasis protein (lipoprotein)
MRGGFALDDSGGVFTECSTRRRWPVEGDALSALENAYHAQRMEPGEALLVRVEGDISERPRARGGSDTVLTVSRLVETFPSEACGESYGTALLEGTSWRLTEVRGAPVETVAGRAPAVLKLESATAQFASSGGCNRQLGSFRRNGEQLSFTPAVTTRDACPPGMQAEQAFVGILASVAGWRILGQTLELSDAAGVVLARFEAQ